MADPTYEQTGFQIGLATYQIWYSVYVHDGSDLLTVRSASDSPHLDNPLVRSILLLRIKAQATKFTIPIPQRQLFSSPTNKT